DEAAREAGRDPRDIRRLLNVVGNLGGEGDGELDGPVELWIERLTRWAVEDGISGFFAMADDPRMIDLLSEEIAPAVRELVAEARAAAAGEGPPGGAPDGAVGDAAGAEGGAEAAAAAAVDGGRAPSAGGAASA